MAATGMFKTSDASAAWRIQEWMTGALSWLQKDPTVQTELRKRTKVGDPARKKAAQTSLPLNYGNRRPTAVTGRLRYASFVSRQHRIVYVEAPKAACTALKWILATIDGQDVSSAPYPRQTSLEMCIHFRDCHPLPSLHDFPESDIHEIMRCYRKVCVVRNPYTRLVSAWANKIRLREPGFGKVCQAICAHAGAPANSPITFKAFALWVVETNDPVICNAHWRPQRELLYPDIIDYTDVLKLESLAADLQRLFNVVPSLRNYKAETLLSEVYRNKSLPVNYGALYDQELAMRISDFYADDFDTYGYDRDSWEQLADRGAPSWEEMETAALSAIQQRNNLIELLSKENRPLS